MRIKPRKTPVARVSVPTIILFMFSLSRTKICCYHCHDQTAVNKGSVPIIIFLDLRKILMSYNVIIIQFNNSCAYSYIQSIHTIFIDVNFTVIFSARDGYKSRHDMDIIKDRKRFIYKQIHSK